MWPRFAGAASALAGRCVPVSGADAEQAKNLYMTVGASSGRAGRRRPAEGRQKPCQKTCQKICHEKLPAAGTAAQARDAWRWWNLVVHARRALAIHLAGRLARPE